MKLTDEDDVSRWAYYQCLIDDSEEIRSLITSSLWAYLYCKYIKDLPEVRKHITNEKCLEILKGRRKNEKYKE